VSIYTALLIIMSFTTQPIARIFEVIQPLDRTLMIAVGDVATDLRQTSRTDGPVRVPPEARSAEETARAKAAFIQAVRFVALLATLKALLPGGAAPLPRSSSSGCMRGLTSRSVHWQN